MKVSIKKLTLLAILAALALIIFIIEAQFPLPVPIPGVKLGLANIVTLFVLFYGTNKDLTKNHDITFSGVDALMLILCRAILGAFFTGRIVAFIYSITGGLLGFAAMLFIKRFITKKQIWVCGVFGGIFHNIGQIIAAVIITGTPAIAAYLPVLIITGMITGVLTGLVAQFAVERIKKP